MFSNHSTQPRMPVGQVYQTAAFSRFAYAQPTLEKQKTATFTLFSCLPAELRIQIWEKLLVPRIIHSARIFSACPSVQFELDALRATCKESRTILFKQYEKWGPYSIPWDRDTPLYRQPTLTGPAMPPEYLHLNRTIRPPPSWKPAQLYSGCLINFETDIILITGTNQASRYVQELRPSRQACRQSTLNKVRHLAFSSIPYKPHRTDTRAFVLYKDEAIFYSKWELEDFQNLETLTLILGHSCENPNVKLEEIVSDPAIMEDLEELDLFRKAVTRLLQRISKRISEECRKTGTPMCWKIPKVSIVRVVPS